VKDQNVVKLFKLSKANDSDSALTYEFDFEVHEQHAPNVALIVNLTGSGLSVCVCVCVCVCVLCVCVFVCVCWRMCVYMYVYYV